jgi:plastocyanin
LNPKHIAITAFATAGSFFLLNACNAPTPTVTACPATVQAQSQDDATGLKNAYLPANCTIKLNGSPKTVKIQGSFQHPFSTSSGSWPSLSGNGSTDQTVTFSKPGAYGFACVNHTEMVGVINVEN